MCVEWIARIHTSYSILANMFHILLLILPLSQASVPSPKIIGGKCINITEVPYTAILVRQSRFFTGATIISEKFVLVTASALKVDPPEAFQVRVGTSFRDKGGELYDVKNYTTHPLNNPLTIDYDCGVIELKKPIVFGDSVKPIPIADVEAKDGDICKISDWGFKDTVGNLHRQLAFAHMKMINREKCQKEFEKGVTERMVCAFTPGTGPYKGDAGDPVVVDGKLIGLASWGATIIDVTSKPAVFTNVVNKEIRDFIREVSGV